MEKIKELTITDTKGEALTAWVVNAIVGTNIAQMKGKHAFPFYMLSLIAPRGSGPLLQAIFARIVNPNPPTIHLEGMGEIQLARYLPSFISLGYSIPWRMERGEIGSNRDLHTVIEPATLSLLDPNEIHTSKRKSTEEGKILSMEERQAREASPRFLLLIPRDAEHQRAQLHWAFLDKRLSYPLHPSWADFLWQRALEKKEVQQLHVWNASEQAAPIVEAWLCKPKPINLAMDVSCALKDRHIDTRSISHRAIAA